MYADGKLHFDNFPENLKRTWRYTGSIIDDQIEYAWLYANGGTLSECCPNGYVQELYETEKKLRAYIKTFKIAKVNLNDHCIFDLVPHDFLKRFCEVKNQITEHVFDTYEKPANYQLLCDTEKLLYKMRYRKLNLNTDGCRHLMFSTLDRNKAQELVKNHGYIDYNLFGTATGRLTTNPGSFPILTLKKEFRKLLKPNNELFVALDYNGAEIRTFLDLCGYKQPTHDIHEWNVRNVYANSLSRDEAKIEFFAWLYNSEEHQPLSEVYDKRTLLEEYYDGDFVTNPYNRKMEIDDRRALNYLIQSTTADRVFVKAVEIDKILEGRKSYISHLLHDEIVLDFHNDDRSLIKDIQNVFEGNENYLSTIKGGKNYFELKELNV